VNTSVRSRKCCGKLTWQTTFLRSVVKTPAAKKLNLQEKFELFIDAVELNSRMVPWKDKAQTEQSIGKYVMFSLGIIYAGICPLATIVCFGYFIIDPIIERYVFCWTC
jgi:hypothetical protein